MKLIPLSALTIALLLLGSCTKGVQKNRPEIVKGKFPEKAAFLYTVNRYSELEPCGCSIVPLGGFVREYNVVDFWGDLGGRKLFYFAAGTTFVPMKHLYDPKKVEHYRRKASYVARGLSEIGVQVVAPTIDDASLGLGALEDLQGSGGFSFVTTNLRKKGDSKTLFAPYIEWDYGDASILILGLTDEREEGYPDTGEVEWMSPVEAVQSVLKSLPPKERFIVVLNNLQKKNRDVLMEAVPELNFVVGGKTGEATVDVLMKDGNSLYVNMPDMARWLGRLDFDFKPPFNRGFFHPDEALTFGTSRKDWEKDLKKLNRQLSRKISSAKRAKAQTEKEEVEKWLARTANVPLEQDGSYSSYSYVSVRLSNAFEGENRFSKVMEDYKSDVREIAIEESK